MLPSCLLATARISTHSTTEPKGVEQASLGKEEGLTKHRSDSLHDGSPTDAALNVSFVLTRPQTLSNCLIIMLLSNVVPLL